MNKQPAHGHHLPSAGGGCRLPLLIHGCVMLAATAVRIPGPVPGAYASAAFLLAVLADDSGLGRDEMPAVAAAVPVGRESPARRRPCLRDEPGPAHVLAVRDGFHVPRVDAGPVPAEVVSNESRGDLGDVDLIGDAVRVGEAPAVRGLYAELRVAVAFVNR